MLCVLAGKRVLIFEIDGIHPKEEIAEFEDRVIRKINNGVLILDDDIRLKHILNLQEEKK